MSSRSVTSRRTVPTNRSAWALARGHRGGIFTTLMPEPEKTVSNGAVNWPARLRASRRPYDDDTVSRSCGAVRVLIIQSLGLLRLVLYLCGGR